MSEEKRVAVVTGGSRAAGRGIAIALGMHGYIVYVTGRTEQAGVAALGGTIRETADAITAACAQGSRCAVRRTGRTLIGAEVALQYGITDRDGRQPPSFRDLMNVEPANYKGRLER